MTTKTIPALWIDRQRLYAENQQWLSEEPARRDAAEYSEWERREVYVELTAVESAICSTPAASIDDVLIKVRLAGYWIDLEHGSGRIVEDDDMTREERMTLMA